MTPPLWAPQMLAQGLQLAQGWERLGQSRRALDQRSQALGFEAMKWMDQKKRLDRMDQFQMQKFMHDVRQDQLMHDYRTSLLEQGDERLGFEEERLGFEERRVGLSEEEAEFERQKYEDQQNRRDRMFQLFQGDLMPGASASPSGSPVGGSNALFPGGGPMDAEGWWPAQLTNYGSEGDPRRDSLSVRIATEKDPYAQMFGLEEGQRYGVGHSDNLLEVQKSIGLSEKTAGELGVQRGDQVQMRSGAGVETFRYDDTIPPNYDNRRIDVYTPMGPARDESKPVGIRKAVGEGPTVPPVPGAPSRPTETFDWESAGYDEKTAQEAGLTPDQSGHMPSRDPRTGMILKGIKHPTFAATAKAELDMGNTIYQKDNRLFSHPKDQVPKDAKIVNFDFGQGPVTPPPAANPYAPQQVAGDQAGYYWERPPQYHERSYRFDSEGNISMTVSPRDMERRDVPMTEEQFFNHFERMPPGTQSNVVHVDPQSGQVIKSQIYKSVSGAAVKVKPASFTDLRMLKKDLYEAKRILESGQHPSRIRNPELNEGEKAVLRDQIADLEKMITQGITPEKASSAGGGDPTTSGGTGLGYDDFYGSKNPVPKE